MQWLKHAFAVEPVGPADPTPEQREVVERLCLQVVKRRLTSPALVLLEMARPLNFVGAQALHVLSPLLSLLGTSRAPAELAAFLERRGSIDFLCERIEELERTAVRHESAPADASCDNPPEDA